MPSDSPPASPKPAWQSTWLWTNLEKRVASGTSPHAAKVRNVTERWMTQMDAILSKGGTSPLDFTLHDSEHALRVAARMDYLLTEEIRGNLSDYELALLLLAAYGHDIGMTPARGKVTAHRDHLFAPEDSTLTSDEQAAFQTYLDEYDGQTITLPLTSSIADLNLADELLTFYVRKRHNDWSADWLRENLHGEDEFGSLQDPLTTLILICTSHHLDVHRLASDTYKPIFTAGASSQIIHLRYLCCLLRLADILENDPERTPAVIMRHRGIEDRKKSLVHWEKDHGLAVCLNGDRLHFYARPHSAVAHRALLELKEWIDHELHGIASFGESLPVVSTIDGVTIRREWILAPAVTHDIHPLNESYEYIDGAFRPDTARLLQLLSGEQLYGDPFHAVRELLQNAFDAVREKIARKRLRQRDPADRKLEETLGNLEQVTLTLRPGPDDNTWQLVCEDTGVGLTREIINHHVLVSGTGRRHAILQLERDCEAAGFRTGLTGQFGIGVLSYFMLADEITLETTRYQGCGDGSDSWHFTTRGVGSFGELKKLNKPDLFPDGGTRMVWGLRKDRVEDIESFAEKLRSYLGKTLIRLPCRFELRIEGTQQGDQLWQRDFGWVSTADDWMEIAQLDWSNIDEIYEDPGTFMGEAERQRVEKLKQDHPSRVELARQHLRCEFHELLLPEGAGIARIILTYFHLENGRSLVFIPQKRGEYSFELNSRLTGSWRGMFCNIGHLDEEGDRVDLAIPSPINETGISIELDLFGRLGSALGIDRDEIQISEEQSDSWNDAILAEALPFLKSVLDAGNGDFYCMSNQAIIGEPIIFQNEEGWFQAGGEKEFRPLKFPAAASFGWKDIGPILKTVDSRDVSIIEIKMASYLQQFPATFEIKAIIKPKSESTYPTKIALFWEKPSSSSHRVAFPNEWKSVALLRPFAIELPYQSLTLINYDHPLIGILSPDHIQSINNTRSVYRYWEELLEVKSPQESALRLLKAAISIPSSYGGGESKWKTFVRENSDLMMRHWTAIGTALHMDPRNLEILVRSGNSDVIITPSQSAISFGGNTLPLVTDPNFLLYEVDENEPEPPTAPHQ